MLGINEVLIPHNRNRHSLIIMCNGNFNIEWPSQVATLNITSGNSLINGVMNYDDWGDLVQTVMKVSGIGALTLLTIFETYLEDRNYTE